MSGIKRSRVRYEKTCRHCQVLFTVPAYRNDTALFCGRKCMALNSRQQLTSNCSECNTEFTHISSRANAAKYCCTTCYHTAMRKKGKTQYSCVHCGLGFLGALSQNRKFCSKKCVNKAAKELWKPTFTTVRKAMARRDLVKACARCGFDKNPEILGVHHKDRNRKNNDPGNLEVLCPNCHSLEHRKHTPHGFTE